MAKCKAEDLVMRCIPVTSFGTYSVFDGLEPGFYSTILSSVVILNEEGKNENRYQSLVQYHSADGVIVVLRYNSMRKSNCRVEFENACLILKMDFHRSVIFTYAGM